ncbi:MAG TPA: cardiolipin synthase [Chthoniobacteraceae bacterium]|nr:cardiolipin synthase [Chthoniobacteraceae bacterium]
MSTSSRITLADRFPRTRDVFTSLRKHRKTRRAMIVVFFHLLGALTSIHAILEVRTSQGAIAWAVSLNAIPYVAVPAYWVFGRSDFEGYVVLRRAAKAELTEAERELTGALTALRPSPDSQPSSATLMEKLAKLPATRGNHVELLIDGENTFRSIFESIAEARDYVLVQFYIIRDDGLGRQLKDALVAKARTGVRCYLLYDEIGSHELPDSFVAELRDAGVHTRPFNTRQGKAIRFQLNFRNHRKVVIVDGDTAFVGGHNVGDEYLGKSPVRGPWRDTHVKVQGPVVQCVQVSWCEDWNWATGSRPNLNWKPKTAPGGEDGLAFCLPSGPADEFETCTLFFLHAIHTAKRRIWIASPYFVPDEQFISALQLAALRGVDVRILVPEHADSQLVYLSGFTFLPELEKAGVQTWRYQEGFLHEKAILVDDCAGIGTANFDNRSFRLYFEITILFTEPAAVHSVESMFIADFSRSRRAAPTDFTARPWWFRLAARTSRLMAPVQ